MPARKRLIVAISCLLVLIILIGIGPIIIALIMKGTASKPSLEVSKPNHLTQPKISELMLMVSGEIALIKHGDISFIILTADSGQNYILIGPKAKELTDISGARVTVMGIPSKPISEEIGGKPIRMTIEVRSAEIK